MSEDLEDLSVHFAFLQEQVDKVPVVERELSECERASCDGKWHLVEGAALPCPKRDYVPPDERAQTKTDEEVKVEAEQAWWS